MRGFDSVSQMIVIKQSPSQLYPCFCTPCRFVMFADWYLERSVAASIHRACLTVLVLSGLHRLGDNCHSYSHHVVLAIIPRRKSIVRQTYTRTLRRVQISDRLGIEVERNETMFHVMR